MKRRTFIRTGSLALAMVSLPGFSAGNKIVSGKLPSFGLITGNRGGDWIKNDPENALKEVAAMGYSELEFGDSFGMGTVALKRLLEETGLKALIGPTSMQAMSDHDLLKKDIDACKDLGKKFLVCYWPWTDDGNNKKKDDWKRVAENLNIGGEICRRNGIQLLYHNHDIEFRMTDGEIPFDVLMTHLDEVVNIELDLYWIAKGGQSAVAYIKKYPGRYPVFHVKDMDKTVEKGFACVGEGQIDFPSIFRLHHIAGTKHYIVEHDQPTDPEACIATAARYLSGLRF